jgi:hypothetical protein
LLYRAPGEHRAFDSLRKFSDSLHHAQIAQRLWRFGHLVCHQIMKCAEQFGHVRPALALQFHRHQRRGCLADRAPASGELDVLQASIGVEFHSEVNLIPARRIIAVHPHRSIR